MANTVQTATLRMLLQDDLSAAASKVATSLKGVSGAELALIKESERLGLASKKLEQFDKVRQTFAKSRADFNAARENVQRLAAEFGRTEAPTAKMKKALESARKEASRTSAAFEKQKTKLVDTKRAFEELSGGPLRNVAAAQATIRRQTDETTAAIKRQVTATSEAAEREAAALKARARAEAQARRTVGRSSNPHGDTSTVTGLVSLGIAHEFQEGARRAIEQYREFDKERRYAGAVMNLDFDQQRELINQAIHGGGTSKFNDIQWLESQREFSARGYSKEQVLGFTPVAADLAQAVDKTMPEAVRLMEGSLMGFHKDVTTQTKAMESARRTADLQVKIAKTSGMQAEDIEALYKRGAAPAYGAGIEEEKLLAFGGVLKKSNFGGDEASTAFRAMVSGLQSPTAEARTAMMASGIDFSRYQTAPKEMDTTGFVQEVARKYGVQLNHNTIMQLKGLFANRTAMADPSAFMPAVTQLLRGSLGGNDAKSLKSIAGLANRYRDASMGKIDVSRLLDDLMEKMGSNPALANAIFGAKNGSKIFAAFSDPDLFKKLLNELRNESQGYAAEVSKKRMAGFDGAMSMLEGSILNLEGAFGRAFDNDGKGGFLTNATREAAAFTQALAEADPNILKMGGTAAAAVAAMAGLKGLGWIKGGFGLQRSATHLDEAAIALKEAAAVQKGRAVPGMPPGEGAKPATPEAASPAGLPKPGAPEALPKPGLLGPAGVKGIGAGLGEGILGALLYSTGADAIHYAEKTWLGFHEIDQKLLDRIDSWKGLDEELGKIIGNIGDKTGPADAWLGGERAAIEERSRRAVEAFRRDPEAVRGQAMMDRFGLLPKPAAAVVPSAALPMPEATPDDAGEGEEEASPDLSGRSEAEIKLLRAAGRLRGYADGGFTGAGGRTEPAGIVHAGEFVVNANATTRHRRLLELLNGGSITIGSALGPVGGSGPMDLLARSQRGVVPVSLATDSSSAAALREVFFDAMYEALRRTRDEADATGGGDGGGSGGSGGGGGTPNMRYGHSAGGGYRSTPSGSGAGRSNLRYGARDPVISGHGGYRPTPPHRVGGTIGQGDGTATTQDSGPGFTAGMRARNLGNIGYFHQHEPGLVGPSNSRDVDHSIALFASQEDGIRAAARLALRKYQSGMHNTASLIAGQHGWTPGALGPGASVNVAKAMGLTNQDDLHLDRPENMRQFLHGLAIQEHGKAGSYYTPEMIDRALKGSSSAPAAASAERTISGGDRRGFANLMHGQYGAPGQNLTTIETPSGRKATVHAAAAESFRGFLGDLEKTGYRIDSLGGYANRGMAGNPNRISQHAYGNAIDINPSRNPFHTSITDLPPNVSAMAGKWGLSWGGDWSERSRDPMHFEWTGAQPWKDKAGPVATSANTPPVMPFGLTGSALEAMERMRRQRALLSIHAPDTDESGRAAEERRRALLPTRPAASAAPGPTSQRETPPIDLRVSGLDDLREAHHHVEALHAKLAGLGKVRIDVAHRGFGDHGGHAPGAVRTALNGNFGSDGRWS